MEFYTYVWRDFARIPFYVGKGKGNRAFSILGRSEEFKKVYAEGGCSVEIVDWFIHESQAYAHEVELVAKYGRREQGGLLVNKTDGGDGMSNPSATTRAKISAARRKRITTAATRAKMSKSQSGKTLSDDHRVKIGDAQRGEKNHAFGKSLTDDHRAKVTAALLVAGVRKDNSTGFKGVKFDKSRSKWMASLQIDGKTINLGRFPDPEKAARAYDAAAYAAHGENCYLNFGPQGTQAA
jgi:hypothetical protein